MQIDEINEQLKALDEHSAVVALSDAVSAPAVPQQEEKPCSAPATTAETASAASAFPFLSATSSHAAASDGVRESGGPGEAATLGLPAASATDGGSAFAFLMAAGTSKTNGAPEASWVPLQISRARGEPEPVAPDGRDQRRADGGTMLHVLPCLPTRSARQPSQPLASSMVVLPQQRESIRGASAGKSQLLDLFSKRLLKRL